MAENKDTEKRGRGRPTQDKKFWVIQCRINDELGRFISRNCLIHHVSESEFIRQCLQKCLDEEMVRINENKRKREEERQQKLALYRQKQQEQREQRELMHLANHINRQRESGTTDIFFSQQVE